MAALNSLALAELDDVLAELDLGSVSTAPAPEPVIIAAPVSHSTLALVPFAKVTPMSERDSFYAAIEDKKAAELQAVAARIKERDRAARVGIIETGNDLIAMKDSIPGHFDRWLKLEFGMSKASAWNYINAADKFGSVPKVVEILPPATVYKLAAKATPAAVREAVVLEIESGATPTKQDVEGRIADARSKAADEERAREKAGRDKAEAERQQKEEEAAWQARAKELADAGKTEAEVKKERQKWDTAKAAKERAKDRAKQKREEEEQKVRDEYAAEREDRRQNDKRIANWLLTALGREKFETLRLELSRARQWDVFDAMKEMDPASIDAAEITRAEEDAATEAAIASAGNAVVDFGAF